MADTKVQIRRSATPGKIPTTEQLFLGELAVNTHDGILFLKKNLSGVESIVSVNTQAEGGINLDGGVPNSIYGGVTPIDAGGI